MCSYRPVYTIVLGYSGYFDTGVELTTFSTHDSVYSEISSFTDEQYSSRAIYVSRESRFLSSADHGWVSGVRLNNSTVHLLKKRFLNILSICTRVQLCTAVSMDLINYTSISITTRMGTHTDSCTKFSMCTSTAVPAVELNLVLSRMRIFFKNRPR